MRTKLFLIASSSKAPPKYDLNKATAWNVNKEIKAVVTKSEWIWISFIKFQQEAKLFWEMHVKQKKNLKVYLNNEFESTSNISIATNNNHDVDIADSHIHEGAATNLTHRAIP